MTTFFQFEADFVEALRCIPMQVRLKLDTCGIKLKLAQWHQFSIDDRQELVNLACSSAHEVKQYQELLTRLIWQYAQTTPQLIEVDPLWQDSTHIPAEVVIQAQTYGLEITRSQWQHLSILQRFALIKLGRSHHESHNFHPALQEFALI